MAIYTYEVDHGDDSPRVGTGMILNGGKVTTVCFDAALERLERLEELAAKVADGNFNQADVIAEAKKLSA